MTIRNISPYVNLSPSKPIEESFEKYLLRMGHLSPHQLQLLNYERRRTRTDINQLLIEMGWLTPAALNELFASWRGQGKPLLSVLQYCSFLHNEFDRAKAEALQALPIDFEEDCLKVVMVAPHDCVIKDKLRSFFKGVKVLETYPVLVTDFYRLLDQVYGQKIELDGLLKDSQAQEVQNFLDALLKKAVRAGASDIHFEPGECVVGVRLRVDGVLQPSLIFHREFWLPVVTRLKILANLNIAETRLPQFGRYSTLIEGRRLDCRLSTHPTHQGESLVIRLLDQNKELYRLEHLGFSSTLVRQLNRLMMAPQGLIIVTGPTGSGKTTTLYTLLSCLNAQEKKIVTLEDPIEYKLFHIQQTEINESLGFGFAEGIRSLMRQDPDVILVGEIRDAETALMAVRAALTGHLVLTTLHTPDALGAIPRLLDLGVLANHLTEVLIGVLSQRLVRLPCASCKPANEGCVSCHFTGYQGRQALAELIEFKSTLRHLLDQGAGRARLYEALKAQNQKFIHDEAENLIDTGHLRRQEVIRVLGHGPS